MTDMVFQFGQFLYNNTADVANEAISAATGIDKNTVAIGTGVITALGTIAASTALTFKYGDTCRKKLSRNNATTVTPTAQNDDQPQPTQTISPQEPNLGGGAEGEQPELGATPTDEANATEHAHSAAENDAELTIGQRIENLGRNARNGRKVYK